METIRNIVRGIFVFIVGNTVVLTGCALLRANNVKDKIKLIRDNPIYGKTKIDPSAGGVTLLGRVIISAKQT